MKEVQLSSGLKELFNGSVLNRVVQAPDLANVAAYIEAIIKLRTAKGKFLNSEAPKSYSAGYAKKRQKAGLPISHVTLFFSGETLDAIRSKTSFKKGEKAVQVGYIEGQSEAQAMLIAGYHNEQGAGRSKVIRRFIGLTDDEKAKVMQTLKQKAAGNIK